jgi:hypothetical protein
VPKPVALQMIVLDLAHALDPQWLPRQIFAGAPAALTTWHPRGHVSVRHCPLTPRVTLERTFAQWLELDRQLLARGHRER